MKRPSSGGATSPGSRAVVVGAGMAGMLAASALSGHADQVVIIDRDRIPGGAGPRKGLPQARHAHMLMSGGAHVIESLLPGTIQRWVDAGARRVALTAGMVVLGPQGWFPRRPGAQFSIACTRDLLDLVVRDRVLALPGVVLRDGTEATALVGDAGRVAGVKVREIDTRNFETLEADLVVDASGRGSQAARRLADLGLPAVREESVDSGMVYATRIFQAPPATGAFPLVSIQPRSHSRRPGQGATLLPIEDGRWLVTVTGTRGGEPTRYAEDFEPFARGLRDPLLADLIAGAEPLTDVHLTRSTVNRRRFFERLPATPEGFVILGDAVAVYNPVYGQGMSVAAQSAAALREALRERHVGSPGLARHVQRSVARATGGAWALATGEDINYHGSIGNRPSAAARLMRGYSQRMMWAATGNPVVLRALVDVMTLSAPMTRLVRPEVALGVALGPGRSAQSGPSITQAELALCGLTPR
ncbi:FAD-dependent monooxygenase [Streptomyces sp. NBC_01023]|uniref:NAD(P)/FAD-dependent oxidoreductase n=1 Tax=Streptomyces sp. NBC_01023 TaxID=2903724 RepID=UPI00386D868A|nr:FAD-dependent monooxygenase [Streptomyces sp. NBC_01023]